MGKVPRVGSLEIEQDLAYQRWEWVFERVAWVALALAVLAALLGLLGGGGPLSSATAETPDGSLTLRHERYPRNHAATVLKLAANPSREGELRLWFDRDYLDAFEVQTVTPPPDRVELGRDRVVFVFRSGGDGPVRVTLHLEPQRLGRVAGRLGVDGGEALSFSQFVYP
jgi:hypothetical protein